MIRKQVYIEPEQEEIVKRRAKELGITEAEVIRRAIEHFAATGQVVFRDPQAWEEILSFIRRRAEELPGLNEPRTWRREDLYEERLGKISRRQ